MRPVHLKNVDLNLILPLQALLEERNVTRAAKRVHLSQPAMSRALERLRESLGDDLLVQSHGKYQLTARAISLLQDLDLLIPQLEALWRAEAFNPRTAKGRIRVAMTDQSAALLLPLLTKQLFLAAPDVTLEIIAWHDRSYEDLLTAKIDLALSPIAAPAPLQVEALFAESFVCLVAQSHPFKGRSLTLEKYLRWPHISTETEDGRQTLVDRPLAELGFRRKISLRLPFFVAAVLAIEDSDLILTTTQRLANKMAREHRLRMVAAPAEFRSFAYSMVWHPRLQAEDLHAWFRTLLQAACREGFRA